MDELALGIVACQKCSVLTWRKNIVIFRGSETAKIMIVGEAPGKVEDVAGIPFLGPSGAFLDRLLAEVGLDVERDVYITTIIKCHPPHDRKPSRSEVANCVPYLDAQIRHVDPRVILAIGDVPFDYFARKAHLIHRRRCPPFRAMGRMVIPMRSLAFSHQWTKTSPKMRTFIGRLRLARDLTKEGVVWLSGRVRPKGSTCIPSSSGSSSP